MARLKDIVRGLKEQSTRQHQELVAANDELSKLREAAQRFRELEESVKAKDERFRISLALLLSIPQKVNLDADAFADSEYLGDMEQQSGVHISGEDLDVSSIPLWKVIREVLTQTSEIRVYELESHLASLGVKAGRSAIESALATHRKEFRITKRGREKFVSLK